MKREIRVGKWLEECEPVITDEDLKAMGKTFEEARDEVKKSIWEFREFSAAGVADPGPVPDRPVPGCDDLLRAGTGYRPCPRCGLEIGTEWAIRKIDGIFKVVHRSCQ